MIELRNKQNTGWAQKGPDDLLAITYPTSDVQRSLEAVSAATPGKPIVFLGQRGRGGLRRDSCQVHWWFHHQARYPHPPLVPRRCFHRSPNTTLVATCGDRDPVGASLPFSWLADRAVPRVRV